MGLFEIVQYEVHVFQDGHWSLRARYTRSERDHAFTEARRIDLNEGQPARVVRDIYDPHSGRSQEFTVFMSERAKAVKAGLPAAPKPQPGVRPAAKTAADRRSVRPAPFAFRATMAVGAGVITALLITAIATWAMTSRDETFASVLARSPAPGPAMTLFVAVILFSVVTLLRGPLGIVRLARALGSRRESRSPGDDAKPSATLALPPRTAAAPVIDHDAHVLALSRVTLARFFAQAAPVNVEEEMQDALGLRGLALYLAGAASELAAHLEMPSPAELLDQIAPATLQSAVREALGEIRGLEAADAALIAAGRAGLRRYVRAAAEHPSMSAALAAWHKAGRAAIEATADRLKAS